MKTLICPYCNSAHNYIIDHQVYSHIVGCEVTEVYDGVLYYICPETNKAFPRDFGNNEMTDKSQQYVDRHNIRIISGGKYDIKSDGDMLT